MRSLKFRYLNRAQEKILVLIPGWGFDYRIFERLDLQYNYLLPLELVPSTFKRDLKEELEKRKIGVVSLFGWSLGAFLTVDFMGEYPQLVEDVYLVSASRGYTQDDIRRMKSSLKKNSEDCLYKFYRECFFPDRKGLLWFRQNFLESYLKEMDIGSLVEGLGYLGEAKLIKGMFDSKKIKFLHGREDKIAPLKDLRALKNTLPEARLTILDGAGHVPFLSKGFKKEFECLQKM